jgi:hypothetical protein
MSDVLYVWKYIFSSHIISVIAHTPGAAAGFSGDNGPGTSALLYGPCGIWLTTTNVLYIADSGNHRIRKYLGTGIISTYVGSGCDSDCISSFAGDNGPATSAALYSPAGVYMDSTGRLFVADSMNNRIRAVDTTANHIITTFAGTGNTDPPGSGIQATSANLYKPLDVKGDVAGNIYIADALHRVVQMVSTNGILSTLFGSAGSTGFSSGLAPRTAANNGPVGIWVDSNDAVYFSDNNSIHQSVIVDYPTSQPTGQPRGDPTAQPSRQPVSDPTSQPTRQPTRQPVSDPTSQPSRQPVSAPSSQPTSQPSKQPFGDPTAQPSRQPVSDPTLNPRVNRLNNHLVIQPVSPLVNQCLILPHSQLVNRANSLLAIRLRNRRNSP